MRVGHMRNSEQLWSESQSRRAAIKGLAGFLIGGPALFAQQDAFRDHSRVPGLSEMLTAFDFEEVAYAKLSRQTYNYTAHGGGGENTVRRNREAFNWVDLVPQSASNLTTVDTSTEVLGTKMQFPIMVAPSAAHLALHPSKEPGTYRGCTAAAATPFIVSHVTSTPFEEVAPTADGPLWFQLYPREVLEDNRPYLERAQNAGSQAIVVTIDQQSSYYDRSAHDVNLSGRRARPRVRPGTTPQNPYRFRSTRLWYEWKLFDGLRPMIKVPMLAKGILTPEDARRCIDHGLDGIIVSNHGGRGLDYSPSTLEVLPEIVDAVGGRIPVLVDSGFRRGEDILKALALGAKAVCLGRVPRWGLGAFGPNGVQKVLEILQAELVLAMRQAGVPNLAAIDRSLVRLNLP
jgi:isopentenyl diphosphate isomerase/L-lactate dehydrogenase-like FMN-dependent dehydrogenase